jgi:hypothetical protein
MTKDGGKWLMIVGGLLGGTVLSMGVLIASALSDGGAQPIPDAYERALRWDETHPATSRGHAAGGLPAGVGTAGLEHGGAAPVDAAAHAGAALGAVAPRLEAQRPAGG